MNPPHRLRVFPGGKTPGTTDQPDPIQGRGVQAFGKAIYPKSRWWQFWRRLGRGSCLEALRARRTDERCDRRAIPGTRRKKGWYARLTWRFADPPIKLIYFWAADEAAAQNSELWVRAEELWHETSRQLSFHELVDQEGEWTARRVFADLATPRDLGTVVECYDGSLHRGPDVGCRIALYAAKTRRIKCRYPYYMYDGRYWW